MYSAEFVRRCRDHWDRVSKPLNSLGKLEDLVCQLGGIQNTEDISIDKRAVVVLCADNGVVAEGVTQTDSSITALKAADIAEGHASVNAFAHIAEADVFAYDVGIVSDVASPKLIVKKIAYGTGNIAIEPAMSVSQAGQCLRTGIEIVRVLKQQGYKIICIGEMGIGNTTTATASACALLDLDPTRVTGRGAGLSDEGLRRKTEVIQKAVGRCRAALTFSASPKAEEVLAQLGGFDIAVMTGVFLGGKQYEIPIVIDGLISSVAALFSERISPGAENYMFASHLGKEPLCRLVLEALHKSPCIHAGMALGEGTGAVALLPLLDMALSVYRQVTTFQNLGMKPYLHL